MDNVFKLRHVTCETASAASLRAAELGDAIRCIESLIAPDEERLGLLSNDLRGLMKVLSREADAISEQLST